jgi:tetratricopeptide (TPR) repeat protein
MIAWGVPDVLKSWRFRNLFLAIFSIILILLFSGMTWKQTGYWENSITLFEHAVEVTENNYTMHYNLGNVLAEKARDDEATNHYLEAISIKPESADAHNNLANVYNRMGETDTAIAAGFQAGPAVFKESAVCPVRTLTLILWFFDKLTCLNQAAKRQGVDKFIFFSPSTKRLF